MFIIHGRRTARIKKYTENHQSCPSCRSFDLEVKVYRDYYHLFFVPAFPIGLKTVKIRCNSCGEPMRNESLQKQYSEISKAPFYLFTFPILVAGLVLLLIYGNLNTQKEKAKFVADPKPGDVYTIRKDENNSTSYYFLRLVRINGDTVIAYHNNLEYNRFISRLNDDDYLVKDEELYFTRNELKQMLDKAEIISVDRSYGNYEGFDRIK